jgi:hypothetical protein
MGRLNRPKTFGSTGRGKYLKETMKTGQYSPEMRSAIVGRTSAAAGQAAQENTARIRGYLQARGMGNSLAGTRALAEPGLEQQRIVGNAARDIEIENEASKARAKEDYGREATGYAQARREQILRNNQELAEELLGAGVNYAMANEAKNPPKAPNPAPKGFEDLYLHFDPEKELQALREYLKRNRYVRLQ